MKGTAGISTLGALLFGAVVYLVLSFLQIGDGLLYALLAAALGFLVLSALLRVRLAKKHKRYLTLEQQLQLQYFHKSTGNLSMADAEEKSGNLYFCETRIVLLSLDETPYGLHVIEKDRIARMDAEDIHLRIQTWDGMRYILTLPDAQGVRQLLASQGW